MKIARAARHRVLPLERWAWESLAYTLRTQGKWRETAEACEHALADLQPRLGDLEMKEMMVRYAEALRRLGRGEDAANVERQLYTSIAALAAAPAFTPAALTRRAEMRIRVGQFKEAAADTAQAMELNPKLNTPWCYRGCLLAHLGDEQTYRVHCDAMLKQFGRDGPHEGERMAKTCLLLAGSPDLADLSSIVDRKLAVDTGVVRAWDQLAKAMAEYRAGRFDDCVLTAGQAAADIDNPMGKATAQLFGAMAHHQLGRHDQLGPLLDELARYAEQEAPKFGMEHADSLFPVEDWLILRVTLREAGVLVRGTPTTGPEAKAAGQ
jgi:tetratricopeptide (TPR) repeat protein